MNEPSADTVPIERFDVTLEAVSRAELGQLVGKLVAAGFDPLVTRFAVGHAEPRAWEGPRRGPYVTITCQAGDVEIWDEGGGRHRVAAPTIEVDETVFGHRAAHELARELAARLEERVEAGGGDRDR